MCIRDSFLGVYAVCRETGIPTKDYVNIMSIYKEKPEFLESEYMRLYQGMEDYIDKFMASLDSGKEINTFAHEFNYVSNYNFTDLDLLGTFFEMRDDAQAYENVIQSYINQAQNNKKMCIRDRCTHISVIMYTQTSI